MAKAKKSKRSEALIAAQADYEARERSQWKQWNMRMKSKADLALVDELQARFPDLTLPAITRIALRELAAKKNPR